MYVFSGPAEVKGKLETWRNRLQFALIFIFILMPWLRFNNQPVLLLNFLSDILSSLGPHFIRTMHLCCFLS